MRPSPARSRTTAAYRSPREARRPQPSQQQQQRGGRRLGRRPVRRSRSTVLGMISIAGFVLFFVVLGIAFGQVMSAFRNQDAGSMQSGAIVAFLSFGFPILGFATGLIGCFLPTQNRILSAIGAVLNGVLLLWMLVSTLSGSRAESRQRAWIAAEPIGLAAMRFERAVRI